MHLGPLAGDQCPQRARRGAGHERQGFLAFGVAFGRATVLGGFRAASGAQPGGDDTDAVGQRGTGIGGPARAGRQDLVRLVCHVASVGRVRRVDGGESGDLCSSAGQSRQRRGQVTIVADHAGGQGERDPERRPVQPARQPGRTAGTLVELLEHPCRVAGHEHQPTVVQAEPRHHLDPLQGAPGQAGPRPAQSDPHSLLVGDEQWCARVEQRGEVHEGDDAHQPAHCPGDRTSAVDGPGQIGDRHGGRDHADDRRQHCVAAYLQDWLQRLAAASASAVRLGQDRGRRHRAEVGGLVEVDDVDGLDHRADIVGVLGDVRTLVHSSP